MKYFKEEPEATTNAVNAVSSRGSVTECTKPIVKLRESDMTGLTNAASSKSTTLSGLKKLKKIYL